MIRAAVAADAAAIVAIWNKIIRDTAFTFTTVEKTEGGVRRDMAAAGQVFLVAEQAGAVLGFATYGAFRAGPGYAQTMEHSVILAPEARGRGIGAALMKVLEVQARAAGVHCLIAAVSGENAGAVAFHRRIGFVEVGRLPEVGRKFDRWMDLIVLQKLL